jgi:L-fucose isomerase-like protein
MRDFTIGFVAFIRHTFDVQLATELTAQAWTHLQQQGYTLLGSQDAITTVEQAQEIGQELARKPLDLLIVFMATFNDTTLITTIVNRVDTPLLLWALPEPGIGEQLRLNSLCGVNLAGHTLTKIGRKYDYIYCAVDADQATQKIATLARAGKTRRILKQARIARVGERPPGFETCDYDAEHLRLSMGVEVVPIDLHEQVFAAERETAPEKVDAVIASLSQRVDGLESIADAPKRGTLSTYVTLNEMAQSDNLHGFAVRCWADFFTEMGHAACGAMSMLSDEGKPSSCEADVNGTITQLILQTMSGEPAFGTDLVAIIAEHDAIALWHCGLAPLAMAHPQEKPRVTNHVGRKLPLIMDFGLKPGVITIARLNELNGVYRLVVGRAQMLDEPKPFHGTSGLMRFERPAAAVMDTIIREGLEHHISITYGDYVDALVALAHLLDMPVLHLE